MTGKSKVGENTHRASGALSSMTANVTKLLSRRFVGKRITRAALDKMTIEKAKEVKKSLQAARKVKFMDIGF